MTALKIVSEKEKNQLDVVKQMEGLLDEMRRGELTGFFGVVKRPNNTSEIVTTATLCNREIIGTLMEVIIFMATT